MTRSLDVTPQTTEQHLIVRSGESEPEVTNNKRLRSRYCPIIVAAVTGEMPRSQKFRGRDLGVREDGGWAPIYIWHIIIIIIIKEQIKVT